MIPAYLEALRAAQAGSLVVTPRTVTALKLYVGNNRNKFERSLIDQVDMPVLALREWPVSEEYTRAQQDRIWGLLLKADGKTFRDNAEARKFGALERKVVNGLHTFTFVGIHSRVVAYDTRRHPGRERAEDVHPIFRMYGAGAYVEYIYRPWQSHYQGLNVGFTLLSSGEGHAP